MPRRRWAACADTPHAAAANAEAPGHNKSGLSSGLSRALCFVNRKLKQGAAGGAAGGGGGGSGGPEDGGSGARVLCIVGSPDDPKQYIAVMNAIFSAQVRRPLLIGLACSSAAGGAAACAALRCWAGQVSSMPTAAASAALVTVPHLVPPTRCSGAG